MSELQQWIIFAWMIVMTVAVFDTARFVAVVSSRLLEVEERTKPKPPPKCELCEQPAYLMKGTIGPDGLHSIWLCKEHVAEEFEADCEEWKGESGDE